MKKISCVLLLSVFAFFACQTDSVDPETIDDTAVEFDIGVFNPIPEKAKDNLDDYIDEQLSAFAKSDDPVRYGCVTFVDGLAIIDVGCSITSGVPRDVRDCDLKAVRTIICGTNPFNTLCTICAVAYVVECDGQLGWIVGFNIVCAAGPIPF